MFRTNRVRERERETEGERDRGRDIERDIERERQRESHVQYLEDLLKLFIIFHNDNVCFTVIEYILTSFRTISSIYTNS